MWLEQPTLLARRAPEIVEQRLSPTGLEMVAAILQAHAPRRRRQPTDDVLGGIELTPRQRGAEPHLDFRSGSTRGEVMPQMRPTDCQNLGTGFDRDS